MKIIYVIFLSDGRIQFQIPSEIYIIVIRNILGFNSYWMIKTICTLPLSRQTHTHSQTLLEILLCHLSLNTYRSYSSSFIYYEFLINLHRTFTAHKFSHFWSLKTYLHAPIRLFICRNSYTFRHWKSKNIVVPFERLIYLKCYH